MIVGYAFIDSQLTAAVVDDTRITKRDLVNWGWARHAVKFTNTKFQKQEIEAHRAIELDGIFYSLGPLSHWLNHGSYGEENVYPATPSTISPWEKWYWVNDNWKSENQQVLSDKRFSIINRLPTETRVSNPTALELISAALTAPIDSSRGVKGVPYYGYWLTDGGERVDITVWAYMLDGYLYDIAIERTKIPGVGYQYPITRQKENGEWPGDVSVGVSQRKFMSFYVHFPNCEVGPNFCVYFSFDSDDRMYYESGPKRFIWSSITAHTIYFPKEIRRIPVPRYQPRTATNNISCYVMNKAMVQRLVDALYNKDIYAKIKDMLYGDGANNLLSLKWFYGVRPNLSTTRTSKVVLGNVTLDATSVPIYNGDFVQVYLGYVNVKREYNDYRDYTNVRYQVYIPMVGNVDLDPAQVVGKDLHLVYTVNLTDGSAVVTLAISSYMVNGKPALSKTNGWYDTPQIVFTSSITYGYEIPLNVEAIRTASLTVGEVVAKTVIGGAAGAIAGSLPGAVIGAVGGAASGALDGGVQSTYSSGALTANSNVMGDFVPKLTRIITKDASGDISAAVGAPSGRVVTVGGARGYLKAAMVYGTPSTTMQHADEIVNMLKEGIYIS